ncbi:MAG: hypothetical protein JKY37_15785 [Nannocystaceae bacterium]|nr:hypothetical protein [Nannocystaceae bacterium]
MLAVPRSLAELAFPQRELCELLHLSEDRDLPDTENYGFGWGVVPRIELCTDETEAIVLEGALVLALHRAEQQPVDALDLDLEFDIDYGPDPEDYVAIIAPLGAFVAHHLPRVLARVSASEVVFALCNPDHRLLEIPAVQGAQRYWWAEGNVDSWRDGDRYLLTARRWHRQALLSASTETGTAKRPK